MIHVKILKFNSDFFQKIADFLLSLRPEPFRSPTLLTRFGWNFPYRWRLVNRTNVILWSMSKFWNLIATFPKNTDFLVSVQNWLVLLGYWPDLDEMFWTKVVQKCLLRKRSQMEFDSIASWPANSGSKAENLKSSYSKVSLVKIVYRGLLSKRCQMEFNIITSWPAKSGSKAENPVIQQ